MWNSPNLTTSSAILNLSINSLSLKYLRSADAILLLSTDAPMDYLHVVGLLELVKDISCILNNSEDGCDAVVADVRSRLDVLNAEFNTLASDQDWDHLPTAQDEEERPVYKDVLISGCENKTTLIKHHLRVLYTEITDIIDKNMYSHTAIQNLMDWYAAEIARMIRKRQSAFTTLQSPSNVTSVSDLETASRIDIVKSQAMAQLLKHRYFATEKAYALGRTIKTHYAKLFCNDNEFLAERSLLFRENEEHIISTYYFPLRVGICGSLVLWAVSEFINNEIFGRDVWKDPTFAIFLCLGDYLLLLWMWGVSIYVWRTRNIDFIKLFGLEGTCLSQPYITSRQYPEQRVFTVAIDLSIVYLVTFIIFNKTVRGYISHPGLRLAIVHTLPTALIAVFLYKFFFPLENRRVYLKMLWNVLTAPFGTVVFRDSYIGDLLTSLVRVMLPMCFGLVYLFCSLEAWLTNDLDMVSSNSSLWWTKSYAYQYVLVPFITLFPLWLRFVQCLRRSVETGDRWPHLYNALKYTSAFTVISLATFRPELRKEFLWVCGFVCATLFQFSWDVTMDWGLLDIDLLSRYFTGSDISFNNAFSLRRSRSLGSKTAYMSVIIGNLILRFAWALSLLPENNRLAGSITLFNVLFAYVGPVLAAIEILRRMIWGFFRVEHEQLHVLGLPAATFTASPLSPSEVNVDETKVVGTFASSTSTPNFLEDEEALLVGHGNVEGNDGNFKVSTCAHVEQTNRCSVQYVLRMIGTYSVHATYRPFAAFVSMAIQIMSSKYCLNSCFGVLSFVSSLKPSSAARLVDAVMFAILVLSILLIAALGIVH